MRDRTATCIDCIPCRSPLPQAVLEFCPKEKSDIYPILAVESDNIDSAWATLPDEFKVVYQGETDFELFRSLQSSGHLRILPGFPSQNL